MPGPTSEVNPDHPYFRFTRRKIRSLKAQINAVLEDARYCLSETLKKIDALEPSQPKDDSYHKQIGTLGSNMFRYKLVVSSVEVIQDSLSNNRLAKPVEEIVDIMKELDGNIREMRNIEENIQLEMSAEELKRLMKGFDKMVRRFGLKEWDMNDHDEVERSGNESENGNEDEP